MPDYRPVPSLAPYNRSALFIDTSLGAQALFDAGQERLDAARHLALALLCSDEPAESGGVFSAFHLLLDDAAGLFEAAFRQRR